MQHKVGPAEAARRRLGHVPVGPGQRDDVVGGEGLGERAAELAVRAGDQDAASRSDRTGDCVLQRCLMRGSFHGIPCSSGSAGSYSSVTW